MDTLSATQVERWFKTDLDFVTAEFAIYSLHKLIQDGVSTEAAMHTVHENIIKAS